jgi:hypothetical protein
MDATEVVTWARINFRSLQKVKPFWLEQAHAVWDVCQFVEVHATIIQHYQNKPNIQSPYVERLARFIEIYTGQSFDFLTDSEIKSLEGKTKYPEPAFKGLPAEVRQPKSKPKPKPKRR